MRLRTTAAVLAGALALVLPTAGPSLADTGDRALGSLYYEYLDESGSERSGRIRPSDSDTCYLLTGTSRDEPAVEVRNATRSRALLFDNRSCTGAAEKVLKPGERADGLEVVSVRFNRTGGDGGDGGNDGRGDWDSGGDQGRGDQGGDDQTGDDQGDWDQGRGDQTGDDQTGDDQADSDQGRGDWQGREDADAEEAVEEEDFLSLVFRAIG
ncbi:hypothetical protein [Streptomyces sp. NBC_01294]|uniref:hypothetical protein n=1 Tax=Streptomyces sp. NBC_01294 TaxID=2903815 RepID=UPI002DDA03C5|nr:hypothetical protein [Streptomyces sp. NBC_01294]WRZ56993.1 hypothetical protein OG534_11200 [Streptomyces sp. NBC_01294]